MIVFKNQLICAYACVHFHVSVVQDQDARHNTCSCLNVGPLQNLISFFACCLLLFWHIVLSKFCVTYISPWLWIITLLIFWALQLVVPPYECSRKLSWLWVLSVSKRNCYVDHTVWRKFNFDFSDEKSGAAVNKKSAESSTTEAPSGQGRTASTAAAGAGVQNPFDFSAMSGLLNVHTRLYAD